MKPEKNYNRLDLSSPNYQPIENLEKAITFRQGTVFPLSYENGSFRITALIPTKKKKEIKELCKREDVYYRMMCD